MGRGQQDHAAHFRQAQRGAHVQRGEYGFHGDGVRRKFFHELRDHFVDFAQAQAERGARGKFQRAKTQQPRRGAEKFHHAVARRAGCGGVHAEHAEAVAARVRIGG